MQHLSQPEEGSWAGWHCEGSPLRALWALLMWDVIFSPVPDVFQVCPRHRAVSFLYTEFFFCTFLAFDFAALVYRGVEVVPCRRPTSLVCCWSLVQCFRDTLDQGKWGCEWGTLALFLLHLHIVAPSRRSSMQVAHHATHRLNVSSRHNRSPECVRAQTATASPFNQRTKQTHQTDEHADAVPRRPARSGLLPALLPQPAIGRGRAPGPSPGRFSGEADRSGRRRLAGQRQHGVPRHQLGKNLGPPPSGAPPCWRFLRLCRAMAASLALDPRPSSPFYKAGRGTVHGVI